MSEVFNHTTSGLEHTRGTEKMVVQVFILGLVSFIHAEALPEVPVVFAGSGSRAVLPCDCRFSPLEAFEVIWSEQDERTVWREEKSGLQFRGAHRFRDSRVQSSPSRFGGSDCSLSISDVKKDDGGVYTCVVRGRAETVRRSVMLYVVTVSFVPPSPVKGDVFFASCSVTPALSGVTVQWRLNNNNTLQRSLAMSKATEETAGKWTCVVRHEGKEGRASASLTVRGIVQPPKDNVKFYTSVGSAVTLPCVLSAGSIPSASFWGRPQGGPVSFTSSPSQPDWDKSVGTTGVEYEDAGQYKCTVMLEDRNLTRKLQLVVAKIHVSVHSEQVQTLTCQLSDPSEVTRYEWVTSDQSTKSGPTVITARGRSGDWTCRFYGKNGLLGTVTHRVHERDQQSGDNPTGSSAGVSAVVLLCLLLLVLVLALAYRIRQKRKAALQFPALESVLHSRHAPKLLEHRGK